MSFRVPTANVSVVDLTVNLQNETSYKKICDVMKKESNSARYDGILGFTNEDVVSTDFMSDSRTSIFDATAGIELSPTFFKIISWYDNEWGYSNKLIDLLEHIK
jgi:glyceraldehyde 3-phosphate dehydrogenase